MGLEIKKKIEGSTVYVSLVGRLDTLTAPKLESEIEVLSDNLTDMIFDMKELDYMSSAGLRIVLKLSKSAHLNGEGLKFTNLSETVRSVFDMTGFSDILNLG